MSQLDARPSQPCAVGRGRTAVPAADTPSFAGIALLSGLPASVLRSLTDQCRWHRFAANQLILDRSEEEHDVFFVLAGAVRVVNYSRTGREIAYDSVEAGGYFGELLALIGPPRSATVIAADECLIASLPHDAFVRLLHDYPDLAIKVLQRHAGIIRSSDDRIMDLCTLKSVQRVYVALLRLAEYDDESDQWIIPPIWTQSVIASHAGTARETVSRVLAQLAGEGVVARRMRILRILDKPRLERLSEAADSDMADSLAH